MAILDQLRRIVSAEPPPELKRLGISADSLLKLGAAVDEEVARTPCIAVIGETGVGKSSTINAIFNGGLPVSNTRACTQEAQEIVAQCGLPVRIVDMPGLGEDVAADRRHLETYRSVLPGADAVLWIIKADNRAMTHVQTSLRRLVNSKALAPRKLVIALNQVDALQPGNWDDTINLPSPEQQESIDARRADVVTKIRQVVKRLPERQIVAYSALRFYNLEPLLEAMLLACDDTRRWVLADRTACADFNQFITKSEGTDRNEERLP